MSTTAVVNTIGHRFCVCTKATVMSLVVLMNASSTFLFMWGDESISLASHSSFELQPPPSASPPFRHRQKIHMVQISSLASF